MDEQQIDLLLMSYSLLDILEEQDIDEHFVLDFLSKEGIIDLTEYFPDDC